MGFDRGGTAGVASVRNLLASPRLQQPRTAASTGVWPCCHRLPCPWALPHCWVCPWRPVLKLRVTSILKYLQDYFGFVLHRFTSMPMLLCSSVEYEVKVISQWNSFFLDDCLPGFSFIIASSATQLFTRFWGICVLFWHLRLQFLKVKKPKELLTAAEGELLLLVGEVCTQHGALCLCP